jgi:hypothetical protein
MSGNRAGTSGGALFVDGLSASATSVADNALVTMTDCAVTDNTAADGGGADVAGQLLVTRSHWVGNQALGTAASAFSTAAVPGAGGHISVASKGYVSAVGTSFMGSHGAFECDGGGGACTYKGSPTPDAAASDAGRGAAVDVTGPPHPVVGVSLSLSGCTLSRLASPDGGAVAGATSARVVLNSTSIVDCFGSGVVVLTSANAALVNSVFRRTSVRAAGGALLVSGASAQVTNCVFDCEAPRCCCSCFCFAAVRYCW